MATSISPTTPWFLAAIADFCERYRAAGGITVQRITTVTFEPRYYSTVFRFDALLTDGRTRAYFAKLPKVRRDRRYQVLPARSVNDIRLAELENSAYSHLKSTWTFPGVGYMQPVHYAPQTGCLIFDRLEGIDIWHQGITCMRRKELGATWSSDLHAIGRALATYHSSHSVPGSFSTRRVVRKINDYPAIASRPHFAREVAKTESRESIETEFVAGLKGFEVRNVRVQDGVIWLFDPGRIKQEPAEADIARFVASVRMLAWGTVWFPIRQVPSWMEYPFLSGYESIRPINIRAFHVLLLKECAKNWSVSSAITREKHAPRPITQLLDLFYVARGHGPIVKRALYETAPLRAR